MCVCVLVLLLLSYCVCCVLRSACLFASLSRSLSVCLARWLCMHVQFLCLFLHLALYMYVYITANKYILAQHTHTQCFHLHGTSVCLCMCVCLLLVFVSVAPLCAPCGSKSANVIRCLPHLKYYGINISLCRFLHMPHSRHTHTHTRSLPTPYALSVSGSLSPLLPFFVCVCAKIALPFVPSLHIFH